MPNAADDEIKQALYKLFIERFSYDELADLAFLMGIEFEDIPGETRVAKARAFAEYLVRREKLGKLAQVGPQERPELPWVSILAGAPPAMSASTPLPQSQGGVPDSELAPLGGAISGLPDFAEAVDRRNMLKAAGVAEFVAGIDLSGPPRPVALRVVTQLSSVSTAANHQTPLGKLLRYVLQLAESKSHRALLERVIADYSL